MERRTDYRVSTRIFLHGAEKNESDVRKAEITNIGPNGAFVRSDNPLPVGALVTLVFRLPGRLWRFKVPGVVKWIREGEGSGYGVEFKSMSWRKRRKLKKWVLKRYMKAMS